MGLHVVTIDPGFVSGCAYVYSEAPGAPLEQRDSAELDVIETGEWLERTLLAIGDEPVTFAIERFTITSKTATNSQAPWSLQVIGQSRWILHRLPRAEAVEMVLQSPVDAKVVFPNPRLKEVGLWHRGGKGHAMDALRHAGLVLHRAHRLPVRIVDSAGAAQ